MRFVRNVCVLFCQLVALAIGCAAAFVAGVWTYEVASLPRFEKADAAYVVVGEGEVSDMMAYLALHMSSCGYRVSLAQVDEREEDWADVIPCVRFFDADGNCIRGSTMKVFWSKCDFVARFEGGYKWPGIPYWLIF